MSGHKRACEQIYLFDCLDSKIPSSSRKIHIRRLADLLQLSIHQRDWPRAKSAWSILTRCPEFEWKSMWRTGLLLIQNCTDASTESNNGKCLEFLRAMMLRCPENRVPILQEIILLLIKNDRHQEALEELELYLPLFPYQDNAALHIYAGLLCLFLAYPQHIDKESVQNKQPITSLSAGAIPLKQTYIRDCKSHLRHAADLDPEHSVPRELLLKLSTLTTESQEIEDESDDASEVTIDKDDTTRPTKKNRSRMV